MWRLQGFYEERLKPWDIVAARLIAIEAGAKAGFIVLSSILKLLIVSMVIILWYQARGFDEFRKMLQPANK